ncbi:pimeloyl-ACP methyl ester carboxylesterase [Agromyces sp. 3263]|uniref:alpha/beta hydrolase n=1 Tax=Agromyces sp. 3263 TaxID=2817750 RepID=UPI00285A1250|nr:alpha/beta hydrolase [Agromyces sp. 3263]MDR6906550.1 pimeloyl-ACP methyl ester carboxylesterase [Agromyces sp. 3263]
MIARRIGRIALWVAAVLALAVVVFLVWAHTVFAGERPESLKAWTDSEVTIRHTDSSFVIEPADGGSDVGLVFIPGARVDPSAYLWKLSGIVAETGVTVVITEPTLNLAFFDQRPLSTFTSEAPGVSQWYVGGHSLGGVRACQLAEAGTDAAADPEVVGLVLFGSYCANDLSDTDLRVLSLVGENDGLSTPAKVEASAGLLPPDTVSVLLEGANHAAFGDYGPQPGDGAATASDEETRDGITAAVAEFLGQPSS